MGGETNDGEERCAELGVAFGGECGRCDVARASVDYEAGLDFWGRGGGGLYSMAVARGQARLGLGVVGLVRQC